MKFLDLALIVALPFVAANAPVGDGETAESFLQANGLSRLLPRQGNGTVNGTTLPRDCGKATLDCQGAEAACNNACYNINCINNANSLFTFVGSGNQGTNRAQSGCETSSARVCGALPFSQKLRDPLPNGATGRFDCDEWPPASARQNDFVAGTVRNSLRCVPASENRSLGSKLGVFLKGQGTQPDKTCTGAVLAGDYFQVEFDTTNADQALVPYCLNNAACTNDGFQFHMSSKPTANAGDRGSLSFPYQNATDNHYQLTNIGRVSDILQCRVDVNRVGNNEFTGTVFDVDGNQVGTETGSIPTTSDSLVVQGLPLDLAISMTGDIGSTLGFNYGNTGATPPDSLNGGFVWSSDSTGFSKQLDGAGHYCRVGSVNVVDEDTQDFSCYFPCYA